MESWKNWIILTWVQRYHQLYKAQRSAERPLWMWSVLRTGRRTGSPAGRSLHRVYGEEVSQNCHLETSKPQRLLCMTRSVSISMCRLNYLYDYSEQQYVAEPAQLLVLIVKWTPGGITWLYGNVMNGRDIKQSGGWLVLCPCYSSRFLSAVCTHVGVDCEYSRRRHNILRAVWNKNPPFKLPQKKKKHVWSAALGWRWRLQLRVAYVIAAARADALPSSQVAVREVNSRDKFLCSLEESAPVF